MWTSFDDDSDVSAISNEYLFNDMKNLWIIVAWMMPFLFVRISATTIIWMIMQARRKFRNKSKEKEQQPQQVVQYTKATMINIYW